MTSPYDVPDSIKLSYQTSQYATGTYTQGGSQVFSHLDAPPASGVAAEEASDADAEALGSVLAEENNPALLDATRQRDSMRDFYDSASGNSFPVTPAPTLKEEAVAEKESGPREREQRRTPVQRKTDTKTDTKSERKTDTKSTSKTETKTDSKSKDTKSSKR